MSSNSETEDFVLGIILGPFIFVVVWVFSLLVCMYRGLAMSLLWAWYAVPLGLVEIGFVQATGLFLLVHVATYHVSPQFKGHEINAWKSFMPTFMIPLMSVASGWLLLFIK